MDFSDGIPKECRTLVASPTMLVSPRGVSDLIEALEVRYLANHDRHLHFALLTDWRDAPTETAPEDEALLEQARQGVEALNEKYKEERSDIFFLFHRARRWNPRERVWIGYERKRGKLADLNALLRGRGADRFALIVGETAALNEVKYVITLDTDTQLPRDAARQLAGTMAHPLNRPCFDEKTPRGLRRLFDPSASRRPEHAERRALLVRSFVRRPGGNRSVHRDGFGCLSGSVRRRFIYRQGHLRRRCFRAGLGGPVSGELDPES